MTVLTDHPRFEGFVNFHHANPQVYEGLVKYAREVRQAGRKQIGIALLWNRLRWASLVTTDAEPFKLPNDYQPFYARLIMACEPDLDGLFATRQLFAK